MSETVFTARALTKTYTSGEVEVHALRGLDLDVSAGEVVVLLGPSGSGKSTLLNIMGGLDHATSGKLLFKDIDLAALTLRHRERPALENCARVDSLFGELVNGYKDRKL